MSSFVTPDFQNLLSLICRYNFEIIICDRDATNHLPQCLITVPELTTISELNADGSGQFDNIDCTARFIMVHCISKWRYIALLKCSTNYEYFWELRHSGTYFTISYTPIVLFENMTNETYYINNIQILKNLYAASQRNTYINYFKNNFPDEILRKCQTEMYDLMYNDCFITKGLLYLLFVKIFLIKDLKNKFIDSVLKIHNWDKLGFAVKNEY